MNYIKFSHDYPKLKGAVFPTIRRYDRYPTPGKSILVKTPSEIFAVKIIDKTKRKLELISTPFLCYDTNMKDRESAIKLLNAFYRKPITEGEEVTILWLKRVRGSSGKVRE